MLKDIQHREQLAEGIEHVATPGHGYYFISPERLAIMEATTPHLLTPSGFYPHWRTNDNPRFFEEDCEWARVVLAFPHEFESDIVAAAEKTIQHFQPFIADANKTRAAEFWFQRRMDESPPNDAPEWDDFEGFAKIAEELGMTQTAADLRADDAQEQEDSFLDAAFEDMTHILD